MKKPEIILILFGMALGVLVVVLIVAGWWSYMRTQPAFSDNIWLSEGQRLEDSIDLSVFSGFSPSMNLNDAKEKFGPPSQTRFDDLFKNTVYLWTNAYGTTGLILVPGSYPPPTWQLWGKPADPTPRAVIRDAHLLAQITGRLHPEKKTWVHVSDTSGQVRFLMDQYKIDFMTFSGKPRSMTRESNQVPEDTARKLAVPQH